MTSYRHSNFVDTEFKLKVLKHSSYTILVLQFFWQYITPHIAHPHSHTYLPSVPEIACLSRSPGNHVTDPAILICVVIASSAKIFAKKNTECAAVWAARTYVRIRTFVDCVHSNL